MKREYLIFIILFIIVLFFMFPKKSFMENTDEILLKVGDRTYVINKNWKLGN